jgi:hypothetical protein
MRQSWLLRSPHHETYHAQAVATSHLSKLSAIVSLGKGSAAGNSTGTWSVAEIAPETTEHGLPPSKYEAVAASHYPADSTWPHVKVRVHAFEPGWWLAYVALSQRRV